jgi:hypothetical protein
MAASLALAKLPAVDCKQLLGCSLWAPAPRTLPWPVWPNTS